MENNQQQTTVISEIRIKDLISMVYSIITKVIIEYLEIIPIEKEHVIHE